MSDFPENIVEIFKDFMVRVDGVNSSAVYGRSLNPTDPNGAVGIQVEEWVPGEVEMMGRESFESMEAIYLFTIQHVVKHASAEEGQRIHREVAKSIRLMLYRDGALQLALRQTKEVREYTEKFQGLKVTGQRYASNDIQGQFVFLSVTEVTITTETL